jgi:hypothetical protein
LHDFCGSGRNLIDAPAATLRTKQLAFEERARQPRRVSGEPHRRAPPLG